jgi:hypothetical protein
VDFFRGSDFGCFLCRIGPLSFGSEIVFFRDLGRVLGGVI